MNPTGMQARLITFGMVVVASLANAVVAARGASFYPRCYEQTCSFGQCTGGWADGGTRHSCLKDGGKWYTAADTYTILRKRNNKAAGNR